jgi:pyruvate dehydrogenase (quinone)
VIALTGDGGFDMLMGKFLTAVQHKLPVKVVVSTIQRLARSRWRPRASVSCRSAGHPAELMSALAEAFTIEGPAIVDSVVVADEMPNLPHVNLERVKHFALATMKPCSP